ncbi:MAG: DMT family transporter [Desulfopila sp.]
MTNYISSQRKAYLALLVLVLIWGYNWVVMKIAISYAGPFDFAALRLVLSSICFFALLLWFKKPLRPAEIRGTFFSGILQLSGFYGLSAWAMVNGGAGKTAVLAYGMPFWVVLLAWPILGERLQKIQWFSVVLALAGLLCILVPLNLSEGLLSKGLALFSGISWAAGVIVSKRLQKKVKVDLLSYTTWQTIFASIPLVVIAFLVPGEPIHWSFTFVVALFYCIIPGSVLAWLIWFYSLNRLTAGSVGLAALGAPIIGVIAAWLQMGERPDGLEAVGIVLVIAALALNTYQALKP